MQPAQERRMAAPLLQYGDSSTSVAGPSVPQFGAPLPIRALSDQAKGSSTSGRVLDEDDVQAGQQELYRQKIE